MFQDGELRIDKIEPMPRGHQERLPVMISELFRESGLTPKTLTHIGVTLGPGSFTGLRVGLSFAKGLAVGQGVALKGIGTLEALNHHADLTGRMPLAVINGGRGNFYVQRGNDPAQTLTLAEITEFARDHPFDILSGPAAREAGEVCPGIDIFEQGWPSLDALAELTLAPGHDDVTPLYMRGADAVASTRGIITLELAS